MPEITCICNKINNIKSEAKFIILSNEREVYRNTNTARVLKLVNPESTEVIIWKRGESNKEILKYISDNNYDVFLIFPTINDELKNNEVKYMKSDKTPVFIIIDGTWNEAWKIIRKSEYLRQLPIISLEINKVSKFILRRGQEDGNLCTIETAIELLKLNEEIEVATIVDEDFDLFIASYICGSNGHKI